LKLLFWLYETLTGRPVPEAPEEWKRPSGLRKFGFWAPLACLIVAGILHLFFAHWHEAPASKYLEPTPYWGFCLWGAGSFAGIALLVFLSNRRWPETLSLLASYAAFGCLIAAYLVMPRPGRIVLVGLAAASALSWGAITGLRRLLAAIRAKPAPTPEEQRPRASVPILPPAARSPEHFCALALLI
jgi:hypothetical protein